MAEEAGGSDADRQWAAMVMSGDQSYRRGQLADAERGFRDALRFAENSGLGEVRVASTLHGLGRLTQDQGRCADSRFYYSRALQIWERLAPAEPDWWVRTTGNLIGLYIECGDYGSAERLLRAKLPQIERIASDPAETTAILTSRAALANKRGNYKEAEDLLRRTVAILEAQEKPDNIRLALAASSLSSVYLWTGRLEEARTQSERALQLLEKEVGPNNPLMSRALNNLACVYAKLHRLDEAVALFRRGINLAEATMGPDHPFTTRMMFNYSAALRQSDRKREANAVAAEAKTRSRSAMRAGLRQTVDIHELTPAGTRH